MPPMGMNMTEKILAGHAGKVSVAPGENIWVDVDVLMTHDVCGPGTIQIFHKQFGAAARVWDREKVVVIPDHYIFTKDLHAHRNLDLLRNFVREQDLPYYYDVGTDKYKGVCHIALPEEGHTRPGEVLFGTDSHTCTAGAFGEFASGIGNTDAAFIMGTGKLWVKVPETMRFVRSKTSKPFQAVSDDPDARFHSVRRYKSAEIQPTIAKPHSPDNRGTARECRGTKLDRAYIGSCTGGKLNDFMAAAKIL